MFCYQCEQTFQCTGCIKLGVCGKTPEVAALQDLLLYLLKGLSQIAISARDLKIDTHKVDIFITKALFTTITNVSFDPERIANKIRDCVQLREELKTQIKTIDARVTFTHPATTLSPEEPIDAMVLQATKYGIMTDLGDDQDLTSIKNLLIYGVKGIAAYADHAHILGQEDPAIFHFMEEALAATFDKNLSVTAGLNLLQRAGEVNLRTMELLDAGNTGTYGHPVPTEVPLGARKGKAILVSGHDLRDLELLLQQTVGKGIYVYTHGEMLPCHGYPKLKQYPHFYGHYGTAWQNQTREFAEFPGAILMTTNCIQRPAVAYKDNIFTTGEVSWPNVSHISNKDFTPVIEKALQLPGFAADIDRGSVMVGFARNTVLSIADKIIDMVKAHKIRHFFLVAGCDGAKPGRNYYTEFVEKVPEDCIVLTLACGKFRFFNKKLGSIDDIPRLLDIGQCNDSYSAIQIALALAKAFNVGVNDLPLSLVISWYEQKAVAVLLTLLSLGIKNIRLGPTLPAFVSPNVLKVLIDKYNIKLITTPEQDLQEILQAK